MPRLKDRNRQIPNGMVFYQPETQWKAPLYASFNVIVESLIAHRKANPFLIEKNGWSVDPVQVADEVDAFNATVCQRLGWGDYIMDGGGVPSVPFPSPPKAFPGKLNQVAAGAKTLVKWIASGAEAVFPEVANKRAGVCVTCPLNGKGAWESFFTVPVSNAIRAALDERKGMNLSTFHDENLGVCEACSCPLKLKVHMKIDAILADIPKESFDSLWQSCWIRTEKK